VNVKAAKEEPFRCPPNIAIILSLSKTVVILMITIIFRHLIKNVTIENQQKKDYETNLHFFGNAVDSGCLFRTLQSKKTRETNNDPKPGNEGANW
jgi:hypothetical protein